MKKSNTLRDKKPSKKLTLEDMYKQLLMPMTQEQWSHVTSLEQPSLLRLVPSKTAYSTTE